MKRLYSILLLLLIPLTIAALYLEVEIPLLQIGHKIAQILIVVLVCWLAYWLMQNEEISRLKESIGTGKAHEKCSQENASWKLRAGNSLNAVQADHGNGHRRKAALESQMKNPYTRKTR